MTDQTYNGWTNWETWNFKLWIENEESTYREVLKMGEGKNSYQLSLELESWAEMILEGIVIEPGFYADVCLSAIKEIDFYEIAESYILELSEDN